jgi:ankyrin repeat protein
VEFSNPCNIALEVATRSRQVEVFKLLLNDARVQPNYHILMMASLNGLSDFVKLLLDDGRIDPTGSNSDVGDLLSVAARQGHLEVVALLLRDKRMDPTANDNSALISAIERNHSEIVKYLLKDGRIDLLAIRILLSIALQAMGI